MGVRGGGAETTRPLKKAVGDTTASGCGGVEAAGRQPGSDLLEVGGCGSATAQGASTIGGVGRSTLGRIWIRTVLPFPDSVGNQLTSPPR